MQHLTIGVFGDIEFANKIAKKGTINDIMIHNHASSEGVFTYVSPNSPEAKIAPLLQTINMIDLPLIVSNELTKELAEQIIALDAFGFDKGFIISNSEDLKKIIKGTTVEKFEWIQDEKELRERLKNCKSAALTNSAWIPIDNYFDVKSVGTVVLSVIKGGAVKKHDKLTAQPIGKEVVIKGIQSQDKDIDSAEHGMRAGLNLKGVDADELKRGYVLCADAKVSKSVSLEFARNKYSKEPAEKGHQVYLSVGLQVIAGMVEKNEGGSLTLLLEQPAVFFAGQKCLIASTKPAMPRIIGTGKMK